MRAAVFDDVGAVGIDLVVDPIIELPTDAIIRIVAAGVCGSDLWFFRGTDPIDAGARLGHEFVGVIEDIGAEVRNFRAGDVVVAPFSYADGSCPTCLRGLPTSCPNAGIWGGSPSPGGAQAEAIRVPFADVNLVRLPDCGDDPAELVRYVLLADVLPTGQHAVTCGEVTPESTVVIVGDGPVALATVLAARRAGVERVVVLGHHPARLAIAESLGAADGMVAPDVPADARQLVHETFGDGATTAIDCVGTQLAVSTALACVRDGGIFSQVGLPVSGAAVNLIDLFDRNLTIRGGIAPARNYLPALLTDMLAGVLDPEPIIDLRLPLSDVQSAYEAMNERKAVKPVVVP